MTSCPRLLLTILAAALWITALPYFSLIHSSNQRWILFVTGAALMVLSLTHNRSHTPDPGPFESGLGNRARTAPLSIRPILLITAIAFTLRFITLGQPVAGDDFGFLRQWDTAPQNPFLSRLPLAICGGLTPLFLYLLIRRSMSEPPALLTAAVLSVAPAHVALSQTLCESAPAILLFVLSSFVLERAIARDKPLLWWMYGLLLTAAVPMGPWTLALLIGHAGVVLVWSFLRRVSGYPLPPLKNYLVVLTLVSGFQAFFFTVSWRSTGLDLAWVWLPMGIDHGPIPILVWIAAVPGLIRLIKVDNAESLYLLLAPAGAAYLLIWFAAPFDALPSVPWPILPGLLVLSALGLHGLFTGIKTLLTWTLPGRISATTLYHMGIVLVALLLALAILPGLKSHFHRPTSVDSGTGSERSHQYHP